MTRIAPAQPIITILLSTYNGARFLAEQLESFLAQDYTNWVLRWRDDGSADNTIGIMRDFARRVGESRCVESPSSGPHLGASQSFLTLLAENQAAEAVAFADQDDVWLTAKLRHAVERLSEVRDRPALYCARQVLVDERLRGSRLSVVHRGPPGFPACLTQNIANGNTLVMNTAAASLVAAMERPVGTVHDWWSYIVVSACGGTVLFDERPGVLYRLHKGNLIGSARPLPARAMAAIKRGPAIFMTMMRRHADTLGNHASRLTPQARHDLRLVRTALHGGLGARLVALRCPRFRRRTLLENLLFSYWFATDRPADTAARHALPAWAPEAGTAVARRAE